MLPRLPLRRQSMKAIQPPNGRIVFRAASVGCERCDDRCGMCVCAAQIAIWEIEVGLQACRSRLTPNSCPVAAWTCHNSLSSSHGKMMLLEDLGVHPPKASCCIALYEMAFAHDTGLHILAHDQSQADLRLPLHIITGTMSVKSAHRAFLPRCNAHADTVMSHAEPLTQRIPTS